MASLFTRKFSVLNLVRWSVSLETAFTFTTPLLSVFQNHRVTEEIETARHEVFLGRIGNDGCLANGQVW